MMNVILPYLCVECSIWWALLPEVNLSLLLHPPTELEIWEVIEGMRNSLAVIIDLEETLFPEEVINKMIEVVEGAQPERNVEGPSELQMPDQEYKEETLAILISSIALAMMLTFAAVKMSAS